MLMISQRETSTRARDLVHSLWQSGTGCLSIQVLQEFYVNVTQKVAKPLTPNVTAQIIADLSTWNVHRPGIEDVLDAIQLQRRYQISFWDAMIVASAIQLSCDTIWSEDLNTNQVYDTVTVTSPF
jgi:predicted nucleic acid-binding protein